MFVPLSSFPVDLSSFLETQGAFFFPTFVQRKHKKYRCSPLSHFSISPDKPPISKFAGNILTPIFCIFPPPCEDLAKINGPFSGCHVMKGYSGKIFPEFLNDYLVLDLTTGLLASILV